MIHTHAITAATPLGERVADLKRAAQKQAPRKLRRRWDCGVQDHVHWTRAEAVACIDGVLGEGRE